MLLKGRSESDELMAMRYLNARMELTEKEKFHYLNLEKGYEGEMKFDLLAETLQEERYIINDLLLEVNNSYVQIDSLIISQGVIHLFDIKNFEGDCYLESDKLYAVATGREYKNPVDQLKRSGTLFRQLLQNLKQNHLVESSVIFINHEFTLYQSPMNQPIILPTQVTRFLNNLNKTQSKLNDGHKKLAQKLISLHQTKNPFTVFPEYNYDQLQKGIYCKTCNSFQLSIKNNDFVCGKCGRHEKIKLAILRNVKEFKLLFPDRKITTQNIYEWCKVDLNKRTFCRILKKNYTAFGNTRDTYYK
ncbi:nuclease-related domain-containing protein [Neobacillus sp. PS3-34]|uniref:nuclease-related domain-containing protein n=1 Tax=Neobacillus sp. PS3-34 TaxID=3070678 RepID=UPI0027E13F3A|nr:nuclease-related domain-containing protein [Neobacillus sp. PS3-34]WML46983.1 nuclease-related domain-containing protein [Neobacillus sp. PS3-34]